MLQRDGTIVVEQFGHARVVFFVTFGFVFGWFGHFVMDISSPAGSTTAIDSLHQTRGAPSKSSHLLGTWVGAESSWNSRLHFYGHDNNVLSDLTALPCSSLQRRVRTLATIRPLDGRIIVNAECKPAPGTVDAGVCVQMPSQQRREVACLPSLVIFGFQKCGTGELQGWLSTHPSLHRWQGNSPQKSGAGEADFFNRLGTSSNKLSKSWMDKYLRAGFILTKPSDASRVYTFEKSPNYGHMGRQKIATMHSLLPSAKLITLVRNPTARAYSGYQHTCMKGRVFQINPNLKLSSKSEARNLLKRELAGRIVVAENKTQAVEGLYVRFGRFAIFEAHLRQLKYPCSPNSFDDFLMISSDPSTLHARSHLTEEIVESLLDVRGTEMSSILSHGLYAEAIADYLTFYSPEQLLVLFTEEMQMQLLPSLETVMAFLGIPFFDYLPFARKNARGGVVATFQRSKTAYSSYLPMSQHAQNALDSFYTQPNLDLAKVLGDDRVATLWKRKLDPGFD